MLSFFDKIQVLYNENKFLTVYIYLYVIILFIISYLIPGNDYDSLAINVVRHTLERFGPIQETATSNFNLIAPTTYDYILAFFLELGHFSTLPSFLLFVLLLLYIIKNFETKTSKIAIIILFSTQLVVISIDSLKNDLALGIFMFMAWAMICRAKYNKFYFMLSLIPLCLMAGTKWFGLIMSIPFGIILLIRLFKENKYPYFDMLLALTLFPLYIYLSSAGVYFHNFIQYGTPFPVIPELQSSYAGFKGFFRNLIDLLWFGILDTFFLPFYLLDNYLKTNLWSFFYASAHIFPLGYSFMPSAISGVYGITMVIVVVCSIVAIFSKKEHWSIRVSGALSIINIAIVMYSVNYSQFFARYMLSGFILGVIPAAIIISHLRIPRWISRLAITYMVIISIHALLFGHERPLIRFTYTNQNTGSSWVPMTVWARMKDPDMLYFGMWSGYWDIYKTYRSTIHKSDSLLILVGGDKGSPPFLFPFLKDRDGSNTRIVDIARGVKFPKDLSDYKYIFSYYLPIQNPDFQPFYSYGKEVRLYKRYPLGIRLSP